MFSTWAKKVGCYNLDFDGLEKPEAVRRLRFGLVESLDVSDA